MEDLQFTSTVPFSEWPSTLIGHVWLYDTNHPATLYASVVDAEKTKTTVEISCPTSVSGCGDDFVPETVTRFAKQYYGASLIRGEKTSSGTTTAWVCDLQPNGASMGDDGMMNISMKEGEDLKCAATTGKDVNIKDLKPTAFHGECFSLARPAIAYTTAGLENLKDSYPYFGQQEQVKGGMKQIASELSAVMRGDFESVCTDKEDLEDAMVTRTTTGAGTGGAAKTSSGEVKETGGGDDDDEREESEKTEGEEEGQEEESDGDGDGSSDGKKKKGGDDDSGSVRLSAASVSMGLMILAAALVSL